MMRAVLALVVGLWLVSPTVAFAEREPGEPLAHEITEEMEGHDVHGDLQFSDLLTADFLGTLINFGVLLLILGWVIRKKGNPALAARRAEVEKELAEAQRLRADAEARHMATATRLEKLDQEILQIRADMIKAGEAERDRIVAQAEEKAARLRKDTSFLIEQQMKQLRKELTERAATAAVMAAQDILRERTTEADQERLAEAYLAKIDEVVQERDS
jgi:F-type H+-transporting ATPase subunit b